MIASTFLIVRFSQYEPWADAGLAALERNRCERKLLQFLLGHDRFAFATAILLLLYNGIRAYLTHGVGTLRDREIMEGTTPALEEIGKLSRLHLYMPALWLFALAMLVASVHAWLTTEFVVWT